METLDAVLAASSPLSHGPDGTDLGYVIALTVTDRREGFRFVHASDVQGPLSPVATAYLIRERPNLLYLSGPPAYLERELGSAVIDRGIANLSRDHRRDGLPRRSWTITPFATPGTRSDFARSGRAVAS